MVFVDAFLDAADEVLNSNTFLVKTMLVSGDVQKDLTAFIASDDFLTQILEADIARGWFNLHDSFERETPAPKAGLLVRPAFVLKVRKATLTAQVYLVAMLTADRRAGNFFSFYQRARSQDEARILTRNLMAGICGDKSPDLYILEPDFLADATTEPGELYYFEGSNGACDSAAAIVCGQMAYLLLTNGAP